MPESIPPVTYQLKIVLVCISPMIWRRIKVSSNLTIADLHYIIQIVMGSKEEHLHKFLIHGIHYGINYPGTGGLMGNAHEIKLSKFGFREREKFSYEYDFNCSWKHQHGDCTSCLRSSVPRHQIKVEAILPEESDQLLPVCTAGKGNCPPENCGGAIGFIRLRQKHSRFELAVRMGEIIIEGGIEEIVNHREELKELHYWATINDKIVIETVIGQLSERFHLQTVKARDLWHLTNRINRKLLAHTLAFWINRDSHHHLRFEQLISD